MATIGKPKCIAPVGDRNGEGAVWSEQEQALYWTDVNRFLIHRLKYEDNSVRSWFFDEPVVGLVLTDRPGTMTVALGSQLLLWEPATDARHTTFFRLDRWPKVRLNEVRADPEGSLWAGTMRNNVKPDGSQGKTGGQDGVLYRINPDGAVTEWRHKVGISNTLGWSPNKEKMYFGDSDANAIWVYTYNRADRSIVDPGPYLVNYKRGSPDGSQVDSQGYLWNCRFGGGCVLRIAPDGCIDRVIDLPVTNVTTCTFGGPDLRTAFITTASVLAPDNERFAGSLFTLESSVRGLPENRFAL